MMDRLSGAPSDIVNPNGLAFIIVTTLGFIDYFVAGSGSIGRILYWVSLPVFHVCAAADRFQVRVLVLLVAVGVLIYYSKYRKTGIILALLVERWRWVALPGCRRIDLSRSFSNAPGAATAHGRIEGVKRDFVVALERPVVGHGLGNFRRRPCADGRGRRQLSHNLFTEVAQELGFIGLGLFPGFSGQPGRPADKP